MKPDLTATHAALADARRVRDEYRRTPAGDPQRRAALAAALDALRVAWGPEHRAYMRTGRRTTRSISGDPVHVASRERHSELKALRKALAPTSGTPRPEAPAVNAQAMWGHIGRGEQVLSGIKSDFAAARKVLGRGTVARRRSGGVYRSMHELNAEAARLLDLLQAERQRLRTAWLRFERAPVSGYRAGDVRDGLREGLDALREEADLLTIELRAAARQRVPDPDAPRATWTARAVREALDAYWHEHGERPTKAKLNNDPALPHYTTCVRQLGPNPLTTFFAGYA